MVVVVYERLFRNEQKLVTLQDNENWIIDYCDLWHDKFKVQTLLILSSSSGIKFWEISNNVQ